MREQKRAQTHCISVWSITFDTALVYPPLYLWSALVIGRSEPVWGDLYLVHQELFFLFVPFNSICSSTAVVSWDSPDRSWTVPLHLPTSIQNMCLRCYYSVITVPCHESMHKAVLEPSAYLGPSLGVCSAQTQQDLCSTGTNINRLNFSWRTPLMCHLSVLPGLHSSKKHMEVQAVTYNSMPVL